MIECSCKWMVVCLYAARWLSPHDCWEKLLSSTSKTCAWCRRFIRTWEKGNYPVTKLALTLSWHLGLQLSNYSSSNHTNGCSECFSQCIFIMLIYIIIKCNCTSRRCCFIPKWNILLFATPSHPLTYSSMMMRVCCKSVSRLACVFGCMSSLSQGLMGTRRTLKGCLAPAPRPSMWKQLGAVTSANCGTVAALFHLPTSKLRSQAFTYHHRACQRSLTPSLLVVLLLFKHTLTSQTFAARKWRQHSVSYLCTRHLRWLNPNPQFFPWKALALI